MRRFEILNPQGERVGEGVEWSQPSDGGNAVDVHAYATDDEVSCESYSDIEAAREAFMNHRMAIRYLDPPEGEAGKEGIERIIVEFADGTELQIDRSGEVEASEGEESAQSIADAVRKDIAESAERIAKGARRTEHRFQVTTGPAGNDIPKEPRKLPSEWIAEWCERTAPPPPTSYAGFIKDRTVKGILAYLDEQALRESAAKSASQKPPSKRLMELYNQTSKKPPARSHDELMWDALAMLLDEQAREREGE